MSDPGDFLLQIANCEVARRHVCDSTFTSPCSEIVTSQGTPSWSLFQVPEPWSGHIDSAPILFLSSNPSISTKETYPTGDAMPAALVDFFNSRFDGCWVRDGVRPREKDGSYGKPVRYWSGVRNQASELLQRQPVPGRDYVLSEIVHCKSKSELGVKAAIQQCPARFLIKLLELSVASIVVVVGRKALEQFNALQIAGLPSIPERNATARRGGV